MSAVNKLSVCGQHSDDSRVAPAEWGKERLRDYLGATRTNGGSRPPAGTMLRAVPKIRRVRDADYLRYLRGLPCCVCLHLGEKQTTRTEAHHVKTRGSGGGDDTAVPCCKRHHQQWHLIGRKSFAARTGLDLLRVARTLWAQYRKHGWAA